MNFNTLFSFKIFSLLFLLFSFFPLYSQLEGEKSLGEGKEFKRCGTFEYTQHLLQTDKEFAKNWESLNQEQKFEEPNFSNDYKVAIDVIIPVVVHVLHNNQDGALEGNNISEEQILSQIERLNTDFGGLNDDLSEVPSNFQSVKAEGTGIQFCLADIDPDGNPTNGVTRTYTAKTQFNVNLNDAKFDASEGKAGWPRCNYLNIWVVNKIVNTSGEDILGYTQLPGGPSATDGMVIGHRFFGDDTGTAVEGGAPNINNYYKGRTTVHEVGHYFGLKHIWGDDSGTCTGSDLVDDTPNQGNSTIGCPVAPESCSSKDMFMNYMDYTYDECMFMFSNGQAARMETTLISQPSRSCLLGADEASCILGCQASIGDLNTPQLLEVCTNGKSQAFNLDGNNEFSKYQTLYIVTALEIDSLIVIVSDSNIIDFNTFAPGEYGIHPINFARESDLEDYFNIGQTTLSDLNNHLFQNFICSDLLDEDFPIVTVLEPLAVEYELICETDAFDNNKGDALLSVDIIGGSGNFEYNGAADGDLLEHESNFMVRIEDEAGCIAQKIGTVDCPPFDYSAIGFDFLEMQQTFIDDWLYIHFHSPDDLQTQLAVYSSNGSVVYFEEIEARIGVNRVDINTDSFPPGIYIISIDNRNERVQKKIGKFRF